MDELEQKNHDLEKEYQKNLSDINQNFKQAETRLENAKKMLEKKITEKDLCAKNKKHLELQKGKTCSMSYNMQVLH